MKSLATLLAFAALSLVGCATGGGGSTMTGMMGQKAAYGSASGTVSCAQGWRPEGGHCVPERAK